MLITNSRDFSDSHSHAVILLASGLSRRLGQPKQLLNKNNESLICYMTRLAMLTQPSLNSNEFITRKRARREFVDWHTSLSYV